MSETPDRIGVEVKHVKRHPLYQLAVDLLVSNRVITSPMWKNRSKRSPENQIHAAHVSFQ